MARKKIGKIGTMETVLLVGGGLVVAYMLSRPKTPAVVTPPYYGGYPPYASNQQPDTTGQLIDAGSGILSQIISIFG